jgi:hypothetical protein
LGAYPARLRQGRSQLAAYRSLIGPTNPRFDPFDRLLLVSGASGLDSDERQAYVDAAVAGIDREFAAIETPARQTINLTAREGELPISLRNSADYQMTVRLQFDSDKLEFPDQPDGVVPAFVLPPAQTSTIDVEVRTRSSGAFPLEVTVLSPDGTRSLDDVRFTVRSTVVSGVGLVLSIGAGAFLALWWARNFRKTRRDRRLVGANGAATVDPPRPSA